MQICNDQLAKLLKSISSIDETISLTMSIFKENRLIYNTMYLVSISCSSGFCFPLYCLFFLFAKDSSLGENSSSNLIFYHLVTAEFIQLSIIVPVRYLIRRPRPVIEPPSIFSKQSKFFSKRFGLYHFLKLYNLIGRWNQYSFPSLHASRAFLLCIIIYNGLAIYNMNGIIYLFPLLVASITVSFSRLVLQRHFLSDVITGAMVGITSSFATLKYCFL
ncbi:MAG: phosphatase PAP2 family protein [Desulfamplus sp.]|nr:phosphatase PAP2 family protein [Desulfamplus sp.]